MERDYSIPQSASPAVPFAQGRLIIGITGGTGCGKTTLLNIIASRGGLILDCDRIYHELLTSDKAMLCAVEARFPGTVKDGILDRKALGQIVFAREDALLDLNKITHSAVKEEVLRRLQNAPALAAIDAIGLFEGNLAQLCHVTVAVIAPRQKRLERLMERDGIDASYAQKRIDAQHSDEWFRQHCDYTLVNDSTLSDFQAKCIAFLDALGIIKEND